jgi:hypothetical protein
MEANLEAHSNAPGDVWGAGPVRERIAFYRTLDAPVPQDIPTRVGDHMTNEQLFQSLVDTTDATVGVDSTQDGSLGLFHILACAFDWCELRGVDFDATLQEVREHFAEVAGEREAFIVSPAAAIPPPLKTYRVTLTETVIETYLPVEIEADSPQQAHDIADQMRVDGKLVSHAEFTDGDSLYYEVAELDQAGGIVCLHNVS